MTCEAAEQRTTEAAELSLRFPIGLTREFLENSGISLTTNQATRVAHYPAQHSQLAIA